MEITQEKISQISSSLLELIAKENLDIEKMMKKRKFKISKTESIITERRFSSGGTYAATICYSIEGAGIPVELRINPNRRYSRITLKAQKNIDGYVEFGRDFYGNIMQTRTWADAKLETALTEIRALVI
jgi:hypothetical protein